jgi:hypothetical protein
VSKVVRGVCPACFKIFRLTDERVPEHTYFSTLECRGSNCVALDDLSNSQQAVVDLIASTASLANTAHMSEANQQRVGRAVYWTLRRAGHLR